MNIKITKYVNIFDLIKYLKYSNMGKTQCKKPLWTKITLVDVKINNSDLRFLG